MQMQNAASPASRPPRRPFIRGSADAGDVMPGNKRNAEDSVTIDSDPEDGSASACVVCQRAGDEPALLLCDNCDACTHLYCLDPPLNAVPRGAWFCAGCRDAVVAPGASALTDEQQVQLVVAHLLAETESSEWRASLRVGDPCDALDGTGNWYSARVVALRMARVSSAGGSVGTVQLRVHYDGWAQRYNEWLPSFSDCIQPHGSQATLTHKNIRSKKSRRRKRQRRHVGRARLPPPPPPPPSTRVSPERVGVQSDGVNRPGGTTTMAADEAQPDRGDWKKHSIVVATKETFAFDKPGDGPPLAALASAGAAAAEVDGSDVELEEQAAADGAEGKGAAEATAERRRQRRWLDAQVVRRRNPLQPFCLFENVANMPRGELERVTGALRLPYTTINSGGISAARRLRCYWTNCGFPPEFEPPSYPQARRDRAAAAGVASHRRRPQSAMTIGQFLGPKALARLRWPAWDRDRLRGKFRVICTKTGSSVMNRLNRRIHERGMASLATDREAQDEICRNNLLWTNLGNLRCMTSAERCRVQGFTEDYLEGFTEAAAAHMLGESFHIDTIGKFSLMSAGLSRHCPARLIDGSRSESHMELLLSQPIC
jgi:hypothetical protein